MKGYTNQLLGLWIGLLLSAPLTVFAEQTGPAASAAEAESDGKAAAAPPAEDTAAAATIPPEVIAELVARLDDDRYAVREAAQKQLTVLGAPAVEAVAQAAAKGTLEAATRAVAVLTAWSQAKDAALSLAALEHLAALESRPSEAAAAKDRLAEVRQIAAVAAIRELGGRFDFDRVMIGVVDPRQAVRVVIGPQWKGGAEGLRHIADIRGATTLSLWSTPLDEAAVDELAKLSRVRRMEIFGTGLSQEAVAKLKEKLPQVMIDVRGGARLGISGAPIQMIVPGSPADKGGLKQMDTITEFGGKPIGAGDEGFKQLTDEIAKCKPGDTVPMKVLRPDPMSGKPATVDLNVTFDRWGDDQQSVSGLPGIQDPFAPANNPRQQMQGTIIIQGGGRVQIQGGLMPIPAQNPRR